MMLHRVSTYIEIVCWKALLSLDQLDPCMRDCQVLNINILVSSSNWIDPAEVGLQLPGHTDQVHLGGVLVLAAMDLLGVYLILLHE